MKKKISIVISLAFLLFILNSCEQEDQISSYKSNEHTIVVDKNASLPLQTRSVTNNEIKEESCGDPMEFILYAGQHIEVGKISITNSNTKLFVTYDLSGSNWWLSETHLFAGDINEAPFTNSGNPQIGKFPYHGTDELTQQYTHWVSLDHINEPISIIAHAVVVKKENGQTTATETAFGEGATEFSGNRWGWIMDYNLQDCHDSNNTEQEGEVTNPDLNLDENQANNSDLDQTDNNGCMDAYAYSSPENSVCLSKDFEHWGWTNEVIPNDKHYIPGGVTYTYPLYASAYECATDNSILIGEVSITVSGGDSILYASVSVTLSKEELSITELYIYAGETMYPLDDAGNPTMAYDSFDLSLNSLNEKSYTINWLDWFEETNFIVRAKVCPEEILQ